MTPIMFLNQDKEESLLGEKEEEEQKCHRSRHQSPVIYDEWLLLLPLKGTVRGLSEEMTVVWFLKEKTVIKEIDKSFFKGRSTGGSSSNSGGGRTGEVGDNGPIWETHRVSGRVQGGVRLWEVSKDPRFVISGMRNRTGSCKVMSFKVCVNFSYIFSFYLRSMSNKSKFLAFKDGKKKVGRMGRGWEQKINKKNDHTNFRLVSVNKIKWTFMKSHIKIRLSILEILYMLWKKCGLF